MRTHIAKPNISIESRSGRNTFRQTRISLVLFSLLCTSPLWAQSMTGGIYGKLKDTQGVTVVVKNPATGYENTLTPDKTGYYNVSNLAPGTYTVQLMKNGTASDQQALSVRAGAASPVVFATVATIAPEAEVNAKNLEVISVSGTATSVNTIDVSSVENTQIWNLSDVNNLPVSARNLEGIATLQSNVSAAGKLGSAQGYSGGFVQFNGAAPDENRYYINQFDTTNGSNMLQPTGVPDEAISTIQIKSTGYGVQYGSTTGGVTSGTIKQGSNIFKMGGSLYFTPPTSSLLNPNTPNVRNSADASKYNIFGSATHTESQLTNNIWSSGPILQDQLFYYALFTNKGGSRQTTYDQNSGTTKDIFNQNPSHGGLLNLTWNISKDQTLDWLLYRENDNSRHTQYALSTPYNPGSASDAAYNYSHGINNEWLSVLNYTGKITDTLSMSAMYGYLRTRYYTHSLSDDQGGSLPSVSYFDPATQKIVVPPGGTGPATINSPFVYDKKGYRLDFDWYPVEQHHLSFGLDHYNYVATILTATNPHGAWAYNINQCPPGQGSCALPNGSVLANGTPYVSSAISYQNDADRNINKSFYLDDTWQISNNVLLYAGLRHDTYVSKLDNGQTYLHLPYNSPRFGVSWDVHGDSSLKVGATLGRYAEGLGVNYNDLAGAAYISQTYYYTYNCASANCANNGYIPQNLQQAGSPTGVVGNIPPTVNGQVSHNIKPSYQDSLSIYALQQFNNSWTAGATFYVSKLRNLMEYWNGTTMVNNYLTANGYSYQIPGDGLGFLYNPGKSLDLTLPAGPGGALQRVVIPNSYLGMPHPERKTYQLTFTLDHPATAEEPWFLDVSYTWRHLFGNTSGAVNATGSQNSNVYSNGYDQSWEAPAFLDGAGGNLQSDAKNTLKINGYYRFSYGLRLGGMFTASSGVPLSCYSNYPYPDDGRLPASGNSQDSYYCGNQLISRGHAGKTGFWDQLDMDIGYDWKLADNSFSLDLKVTNAFNRNAVLQKNQVYNVNVGDPNPSPTYMTPSLFQAPRSSMLVFRWQYN